MRRFKQELAKLADHLKVLPYVDHTQSALAKDLEKVVRVTGDALKVLQPLQIVDNPEGANFPLFQALLIGLNRHRAQQGLPPLNGTDFPASVVGALIDLKEAAERARIDNPSKRGNSSGRIEKQAHVKRAAEAFVFRYQANFGDWPPTSTHGPAVDAMRCFLVRLGFNAEVDAAGVLKRAVAKERKAEREREARSLTQL